MKRTLQSRTAAMQNVKGIIPASLGGSGFSDAEELAIAIGAVQNKSIGVPNGVANSDNNGFIRSDQLPQSVVPGVTIDGPDEIFVGQAVQFVITNYDAGTAYTATVSAGSISRSGNTLNYTAPATVQNVTLTINGRQCVFNVKATAPLKPVIVSPSQGSGASGAATTIQTNAFSVPSGTDTHEYTDWEVSTDINFVNIFARSLADTVNKTEWLFTNLSTDTKYYIRCRFKGLTAGFSSWSETALLITKNSFLLNTEQAKLSADDKLPGSRFGAACGFNFNASKVVIGAPNALNASGNEPGSAYIYKRNGSTWIVESKVQANDAALDDYFGKSAAMAKDGTRVVIGAWGASPGANSQAGAVYVFRFDGYIWSQEAKLVASDPTASANFGFSVDIDSDGSRIAVGAVGANSQAGAVYVFSRSGLVWAQEAKLLASGLAAGDNLGTSVKFDALAKRLFITAPFTNSDAVTDSGAVYVFTRNEVTWAQEARLVASDKVANDFFGYSVATNSDGSLIYVGSPQSDISSKTDAGAVYVFTRSGVTWTQVNRLIASDGLASDRFGFSVDCNVDGSKLAIGAIQAAINGATQSGAGKAYVFSKSGNVWAQESVLISSDSAFADYFGWSVQMSKDALYLIVGAIWSDPSTVSKAGTAYIFST